MGLLTSAMLAHLQAGGPVWPVLTLSYPGGTKRYASRPVNSDTHGVIAGRVLGWGGAGTRGVTDRAFSLETVERTVRIDDTDRFFAGLLTGAQGLDVEGCAATIRLAGPDPLAESDWADIFTGVVEQAEWEAPTAYALRLRVNDLPLRRRYPKVTISSIWPNALPEVKGKIPPLLYGKWDSAGEGGAVPTLLVDVVGARYLVCLGRALAVDRVYVDGVHQTSGYTVTWPVVGGRTYTCVTFAASQGDATVTVDARGYETTGTGGGSLIENPVDQIAHLLANFVWGDYLTGAWLATATAPINSTHLAAAASFCTARGHKGGRYIAGEQLVGGDTVNEWCGSLKCRAFWTRAGLIAFRFEVLDTYPYHDHPWLRWDRDLGPFRLAYDTVQRLDRVTVRAGQNAVRGDYNTTLEVRDPSQTREAPDAFEMPWSYPTAV